MKWKKDPTNDWSTGTNMDKGTNNNNGPLYYRLTIQMNQEATMATLFNIIFYSWIAIAFILCTYWFTMMWKAKL